MRLASADARGQALTRAQTAATTATLSLMTGRADEACTEAGKGLAELRKIAALDDDRSASFLRADLESLLARCKLAQRDWIRAEAAARAQLALLQKHGEKFPLAVFESAKARTTLATALARQGKVAEANAILQPAFAFFDTKAAKGSDDVTLKAHYAHALFASALANPNERVRRLEDAARAYDAMPSAMRRFKEFASIRNEITSEMAKP